MIKKSEKSGMFNTTSQTFEEPARVNLKKAWFSHHKAGEISGWVNRGAFQEKELSIEPETQDTKTQKVKGIHQREINFNAG